MNKDKIYIVTVLRGKAKSVDYYREDIYRDKDEAIFDIVGIYNSFDKAKKICTDNLFCVLEIPINYTLEINKRTKTICNNNGTYSFPDHKDVKAFVPHIMNNDA